MKLTEKIMLVLGLALLLSGCTSYKYQYFNVALSKVSSSPIEYDSARYDGIYVIITNDLDCDIFIDTCWDISTQRVDSVSAERVQDYDAIRESWPPGWHPLMPRNTYFYVWPGHTAWNYTRVKDLPQQRAYFQIPYYHCKDKGFYVRSLEITAPTNPPTVP